MEKIVIIRGGGDLASGVIQKFYRAGIPIIVLESEKPSFIRRKVCYGEAVYEGEVTIEGATAKYFGNLEKNSIKAEDWREILEIESESYRKNSGGNYSFQRKIPVISDPNMKTLELLEKKVEVVALVDCIIAKKNLGISKELAPITIALGPGFSAGEDVDIVIETMRGHNLGKLIFQGEALPNTGTPGLVGGESTLRVIYSEYEGELKIRKDIGEIVEENEVIVVIDGNEIRAKISGVIRGMIRDGYCVKKGMKIADIDSRKNEVENCFTISDKARALGGAVLEAYLYFRKLKNL